MTITADQGQESPATIATADNDLSDLADRVVDEIASSPATADSGYRVEHAGGSWDNAFYGICTSCDYRTAKKGSERHAKSAIRDHVKAKHSA